MSVRIWWHEPSNYLDIALPNGQVWRHENTIYSKWHKFNRFGDKYENIFGWILIGEFE